MEVGSFIPSVLDSFFVLKAKKVLASKGGKERGYVLCNVMNKKASFMNAFSSQASDLVSFLLPSI